MPPKLVKWPVYLTRHKPVIIHALPMTVTLLDLLVGLFAPVFCVSTRLSSDRGNVTKTSEATHLPDML